MSTYSELMVQAQALLAEAERARKAEIAGAVSGIRELMTEYELTVEDIVNADSKASRKRKLPAKYRGPNGELWAGGPGRKPEWAKAALAAGDLDKYLIA